MNIFITGGAGFIGHHLVRALVKQGHQCTVLDSERSGKWSRVEPSVTRINRDLVSVSEEEFVKLLTGVDILYHLAAEKYNSSTMTPKRVIDVNVSATDLLFRAAVKAGVDRIVFTSSLYAYGSTGPKKMLETDTASPWTHYGISKLTGEQLLVANCRNSRTSWNVARLFFIYGPEQYAEGGYKSVIVSNIENLKSGKNVIVKGDGKQALDYVYVDDCIDALIRLGSSPVCEKVVNVASGRALEVNRVLQLLCDSGKIPFRPYFQPKDWTHGTKRVGSNKKIRKLFGWKPTTPFEEGIRKVLDWSETIDK